MIVLINVTKIADNSSVASYTMNWDDRHERRSLMRRIREAAAGGHRVCISGMYKSRGVTKAGELK